MKENDTNHIHKKKWLTHAEAAHYLSIKSSTLYLWRWEGKGPRYYKLGKKKPHCKIDTRRIRYRRKDLDDYVREVMDNA